MVQRLTRYRLLDTKEKEKWTGAFSLFDEFVDHMNVNAVLIIE